MGKKKKKLPIKDTGSLGSSLGAALAAQGFEASAAPPPGKQEPPPAPGAPVLNPINKLVVQKERKGRGGKTVTVVSGFEAADTALKSLARDLGKALGTGVKVEGETLVVQGGQTERIKEWFLKQGVKRVVTSG